MHCPSPAVRSSVLTSRRTIHQAFYYLFLAQPNPVNGIIDFFLLGPLSGSQKKAWGSKDFQLRDKYALSAAAAS